MSFQKKKKVKISATVYLLPTIPFSFSLFQPSKMLKERKATGKKVVPIPAVVKKQEAKKVMNPLFEKRLKNFGIGQDIQLKRDLASSNGPAILGYSGKGSSSVRGSKYLLPLTSKQQHSSLSLPASTGQRQSSRSSKAAGPD